MLKYDLYIHKAIIDGMELGEIGIGYISVSENEKENYELVSKYAFVGGSKQIDNNSYEVAFILK